MTHAERNIIETYANLFEGLSTGGKLELLERLASSTRKGKKISEKEFFSAFVSNKTGEKIASEIRESRKFRDKDLKL